jgi:potassium efflux system protein
MLIAVATLRIVLRLVPSALAPLPWGLAVLFTIDRARDLLDTTPTLERLVFLGEMVGVLGLLIWLLRPSRVASLSEEQQRHPLVRLLYNAMRAGAGLVTLAILADLAGWTDLAVMLGDGVLRCGYLGLFVFVLLKVFHGLATFALVLRPLRLSRAISNHRQRVDHWLERILNVVAVAVWGALVCGQLGLLAPAKAVAGRVLGASVTVGALSVSVADVLVFALTVWLSFLLARLVQVVLQEDVFSESAYSPRRAVRCLEHRAIQRDLPRISGRPVGGWRSRSRSSPLSREGWASVSDSACRTSSTTSCLV